MSQVLKRFNTRSTKTGQFYQLIFIILALCYYCILDILRRELSPFCAWGRVSTWDCFLVSTSRDSVHSLGIVLSNLGLPINKIAKVSYWKSSSIKWSIRTLFFLCTRAAQTVYKILFFRAEELQSQGDRCICLAWGDLIKRNLIEMVQKQMFSSPMDISILFLCANSVRSYVTIISKMQIIRNWLVFIYI